MPKGSFQRPRLVRKGSKEAAEDGPGAVQVKAETVLALREEAGCRKRLRESSERAKAHSFLCHCAIKTTGRKKAVKRDKKQEESIHVYKL